MKTAPRRTFDFTWLGIPVRVESDSDELAGLVRHLWSGSGRSHDDRSPEPRSYVVEIGEDRRPRFVGPAGERSLDRRIPAVHAYNLIVTDLLGTVDRHFVFHATAVSREDRALVVSGPSTFGKTTLAVHLAGRGFRLLADDITAVERSSSRVLPFHRPLHLRPGTRETLEDADLDRARAATRVDSNGEWTVDPGDFLGPLADPCPVAMVVVLRPPEEAESVRRFPFYEIRAVEGRESVLADLVSLDGIREVRPNPEDATEVRVEVEHAGNLIRWLQEHQDFLVYGIKEASGRPDFSGKPDLRRIGPFQAGLELCQEMLNRHEGSRLADEFRGRETHLVTEVAEVLKGAACWALVPGRLEDSLQLLTRSFEEARP
jgi:hypothetical protein